MTAKYSDDFRADVVQLVRGGMRVSRVSADMGVPEQTIYTWVKKADDRPDGRAPAGDGELAAARRRIRELETENEILRRASAYLSQANLPGKGSTR